MTADVIGSSKLDIGDVIQKTFAVLGRNFATFFALSLILVGLPAAIVNGLQVWGAAAGGVPGLSAGAGLVSLVSLVTNAILQGALIYGTVQDLNGRPVGIADGLATGLRAFLPLIGLSILMALAIMVGVLLLVVPGVMMALAWCVAVPALVAEHRGVFDSFSRSAELTRNNRWRILALFLLYIVAFMVLGAVIGIVGGVAGAIANPFAGSHWVIALLQGLLSAVLGAISSTGAAVLYVELRRGREGAGSQWLAEVFS